MVTETKSHVLDTTWPDAAGTFYLAPEGRLMSVLAEVANLRHKSCGNDPWKLIINGLVNITPGELDRKIKEKADGIRPLSYYLT